MTRADLEALRRVAATGDRDALARLGLLYEEGARDPRGRLLVKRDRRRAREYRVRLEHRLRIEAMHLMADALANGWLARRDFTRAEAWRRRAAALGS